MRSVVINENVVEDRTEFRGNDTVTGKNKIKLSHSESISSESSTYQFHQVVPECGPRVELASL